MPRLSYWHRDSIMMSLRSEVPPAQKPPASPKAKTAVDPLHELMEMLRPRWTADELIELAEARKSADMAQLFAGPG
ncbi:unnamed protein product [Symbiodinium sp. CCMP2592]|nr:unnamed protein product [Symbiodinium sp. CCMP2592]